MDAASHDRTYATRSFEDYAQRYRTLTMERRDGILQLTLHDGSGGPMLWNELTHRELPQALHDIGEDRDNRVVIITGSGDGFIPGIDMDSVRFTMLTNEGWYKQVREGTKLLVNYVNIDVPVIAAVNGPVTVHSEIAVMADIVLVSENAVFQDEPHFLNGLVPGDGIALVWQHLLGPNRGRYFLFTGQQISAEESVRLDIAGELWPKDQLLDRAWELARDLAARPMLTLRYTKMLAMQELRRMVEEQVRYGLVLEGASLVDEQGTDMGMNRITTAYDPNVGLGRRGASPGSR